MTALDTTWHPEHFFCAQCGNTFGDDGFHEKDGKPYCRDDYFNMFAPKCGGCNAPIMDNYISALNAQWHPECFVCRVSTSVSIPCHLTLLYHLFLLSTVVVVSAISASLPLPIFSRVRLANS